MKYKSTTNGMSIDYQWTIDKQWTTDYQFNTNCLPMDNWLLIECQSTTNEQLITDAISIDYQWTIDNQ